MSTLTLRPAPAPAGRPTVPATVHRGHHLVDGRTGRVPRGVAQVTVLDASLTRADVDATTAYALGPGAADWLSHRAGRTGLVVGADGAAVAVAGPRHPDG